MRKWIIVSVLAVALAATGCTMNRPPEEASASSTDTTVTPATPLAPASQSGSLEDAQRALRRPVPLPSHLPVDAARPSFWYNPEGQFHVVVEYSLASGYLTLKIDEMPEDKWQTVVQDGKGRGWQNLPLGNGEGWIEVSRAELSDPRPVKESVTVRWFRQGMSYYLNGPLPTDEMLHIARSVPVG